MTGRGGEVWARGARCGVPFYAGSQVAPVFARPLAPGFRIKSGTTRGAGTNLRASGRALARDTRTIYLSVVRDVGSTTVVPGSVGSYRPVIAGTKLRENATAILPRGRALQGVGLSSMPFHSPRGEPEDDEDEQEGWSTTANPSFIGIRPEIDWPCWT